MKLIALESDNEDTFEAYLQDNKVYLYVNNAYEDILTIEGIEQNSNPIPEIMNEIDLMCKPSLYSAIQMF